MAIVLAMLLVASMLVSCGEKQGSQESTNESKTETEIEIKGTDGLEYTLNTDGVSYSACGIGSATDTDIIIANTYNGLPVTSISIGAFSECSSLTSVTFGGNSQITSIGDSAFSYCSNLTIYAEADSQPSGWDSNWNPSTRTVVWGYTG